MRAKQMYSQKKQKKEGKTNVLTKKRGQNKSTNKKNKKMRAKQMYSQKNEGKTNVLTKKIKK